MNTMRLRNAPEVKALIQAADPSYKKHTATVVATHTVALQGTYWSGGTRHTYTAVTLADKRVSAAPQYDPPLFGGPSGSPKVQIPRGVAIIRTGFFCGETATAVVYVNPLDLTPALTQG